MTPNATAIMSEEQHETYGNNTSITSDNVVEKEDEKSPAIKSEETHESDNKNSPKQNKIGNFLLGGDIGKGSFGKVKLATHINTGQTVAVKIMNKAKILQQGMQQKVEHEIQILRNLGRHPNIAPLYDVVDSPTDTYLVLENLGGGELYDYLAERGRLEEEEARNIFEQLIDGIDYCHSKDIAHRDLKLDNLLLDSHNNVKIADFGLSAQVLKDNFLKTTCGTPHYCAPEILSRKAYHGPEVDVWSCGVILYALLCGTVPFDDENTVVLFEKIQSGDFEMPTYVSESAQDLLSRILEVDPNKRITIKEIRQHPWFLKQRTMPKDHHHWTHHWTHHWHKFKNDIRGDGVTTDPLEAFLPAQPEPAPSTLNEIGEGSGDEDDDAKTHLSHESYFISEPLVEDHHHEESQSLRISHSKDGHHHHHRKWLLFPHWHNHSKHHHDGHHSKHHHDE
jgi:serine/threonine protein kinase